MHKSLGTLLLATGLGGAAAVMAEPCNYADRGLPECQADGRLPVQSAYSEPGRFAAKLIFLADQLERNVDRKNGQQTYIVGSFANLNDLASTISPGQTDRREPDPRVAGPSLEGIRGPPDEERADQ